MAGLPAINANLEHKMSRKDYQLIASVFHMTREITHEERGMKECLVERMADALSRVNENFDKARFTAACND